MGKRNLKGLTLPELQEFVLSLGEPRYRGKQLFDWIYTKGATTFDAMSSLSRTFRARLGEVATLSSLRLAASRRSDHDGTTKLLLELHDGKKIESVLIPAASGFDPLSKTELGGRVRERLTLCVSTQVGCPLDCAFCATGAMGFVRNLDTGEIIDQLMIARSLVRRRITNLVYMGMGEPLMNYDNVMRSVEIITVAMGVAARRITISTAGWADRIRQMADERRKVKLAVSLHSTNEEIRTRLMPITKKYRLSELIDAIRYYYKQTKQRVTYEYIPLAGVNDTEEDLRGLIKLAKVVPCKINIVPFHSIEFMHPDGFSATLRSTPADRLEEFLRKLRSAHVSVCVRSSAGEDIDAACGQLAIVEENTPVAEYA